MVPLLVLLAPGATGLKDSSWSVDRGCAVSRERVRRGRRTQYDSVSLGGELWASIAVTVLLRIMLSNKSCNPGSETRSSSSVTI
ncbi:hypothetical protein C8J55DRAFT_514106 [Lentinula edodes]|uniref:Uncharacterized protein n=1 Tax=Lentinula lateritia TaxID=40482 RepID=A0A9W9ADR0_9AGAR|nr:hypothetical protein C8J55DRAFT_514106 [Lentinula edodes]